MLVTLLLRVVGVMRWYYTGRSNQPVSQELSVTPQACKNNGLHAFSKHVF